MINHEKIEHRKEIGFKKQVGIDMLQMIGLFLASVYFVYFSSPLLRDLAFLIPLFLFWRSKKNYFWFAYFFILVNAPIGIFGNYYFAAEYRLPIYSVLPSMGFWVADLFVILALIKAILRGEKKEIVLAKPLKLLLVYLILITLPLTFIFGTDVATFANSLRSIFYYSVVISFFWLTNEIQDIYKFGYLLLPFAVLVVYDQLYTVMNGHHIISQIDNNFENVVFFHSFKCFYYKIGFPNKISKSPWIFFNESFMSLVKNMIKIFWRIRNYIIKHI